MMAPIAGNRHILKILEPITFPIAKSLSFLMVAMIQVTISGSEVPMETIVMLITLWLTPKYSAMDTAPLTTKSAPNFKPITPSMM